MSEAVENNVVGEEKKTRASVEEIRAEFVGRVGEKLKQGEIPWQDKDGISIAPQAAASGRPYSGINALRLMERAAEKDFSDPRWITFKDAQKAGLGVKPGEKGVALEHWSKSEDGKPVARTYFVFNARQLTGELPALPPRETNFKAMDTLLQRAGFELPEEGDQAVYRQAVTACVDDAVRKNPVMVNVYSDSLKSLRSNITCAFVAAELGIPNGHAPQPLAREWAGSISHNPMEFSKAVRDASKIAEVLLTGLELQREHVSLPVAEVAEERGKIVKAPLVGDRVTFHAKGSDLAVTGEVVATNDTKGIVMLKCGPQTVPIFRGKGYFTEAQPLTREATPEYAKELAQKYAGENGKVFFAADEGVYKGPILETTPTYALQRTDKDTVTLHRLKDLGVGFEVSAPPQGAEVVIQKNGKDVSVTEEKAEEKTQGKGKGKSKGLER